MQQVKGSKGCHSNNRWPIKNKLNTKTKELKTVFFPLTQKKATSETRMIKVKFVSEFHTRQRNVQREQPKFSGFMINSIKTGWSYWIMQQLGQWEVTGPFRRQL